MSDNRNLFEQFAELSIRLSKISSREEDKPSFEANPFINGPIVIVSKKTDSSGTVEYISPNIRELGFSADLANWRERGFYRYIHPDDQNRVLREIDLLCSKGCTTGRLHYRLKGEDRIIRWVEDFLIFLRDESGQVKTYFSFLQDLTHRRQAEERFRILYEIAHQVNSSANLEELLYRIHQSIRTVMYADNFYVAIYDERSDLVSFPYFVDQFDEKPQARKKRRGLTEYVIHSGKSFLVFPKAQPEVIAEHQIQIIGTLPECWLGIPLNLKGKTIGALVVQSYDTVHRYQQTDIDLLSALANEIAFAVERKQSEESYYRQSEWLKVTLASIGDAVIACDTCGKVIFINRAASLLTGWPEAEAIGEDINRIFRIESETPEYPLQNPVTRVLAEGVVVGLANHTILISRDGKRIPIDDSGAPIRDAQGNILGVVLVFADITERRKTEKQIRESEQKFRSIFENVLEGIYQVTPDGQLLTVNPAMVRMLGYPDAQTLIGVNLRKRIFRHEEDYIRVYQLAMLSKEIIPFETQWYRQDFSVIDVQINTRAVYDERGSVQYYEATVDDITARKKLEFQLQQSQKMEVVGTLAGGIAHDFNNMLTVIKMNLQLAKMRIHHPETVQESLAQISSAAARAEALTKKILTFSRQQPLNMEINNLNTIVQSVLKMLEHVLPANIEVKIQLDPDLPNSQLDAVQIEQVLMNICINARDAMPSGGKMTIQTFHTINETHFRNLFPNAKGSLYSAIRVRDTGIGMAEHIKQKIFEPFFTTKESGRGTGLGLSMAYAIVKSHGGFIHVDSAPNQGTTMTVYFPSINECLMKKDEKESGPSSRGHESLLIVEDQEHIRKAARKILESSGYNIIEAADGEEAIRLYERHADSVDLIFIDQMLPKMNALEVHRRLSSHQPLPAFLLTSGYSLDEAQKKYIKEHAIGFIEKPYEADQLLNAIRTLLRSQSKIR